MLAGQITQLTGCYLFHLKIWLSQPWSPLKREGAGLNWGMTMSQIVDLVSVQWVVLLALLGPIPFLFSISKLLR